MNSKNKNKLRKVKTKRTIHTGLISERKPSGTSFRSSGFG